MPLRKELVRVLLTMLVSCVLLVIAVSGVSAQAVVIEESAECPAPDLGTTVVETGIADARLLTAVRSANLTATVSNDTARWQARSITQTSRRLAVARGPVPDKTRRSKVRTTLIGAAIGGSVGAVGGLYYAEATKDGAYPQAIPAFAGIGAGIGAITGFIVALF